MTFDSADVYRMASLLPPSLSLWWDLDPSWRKCSSRRAPPPQHFCAALLLPARRHVPFGKLRIEPSGGLWREWVSFMDSFEFPAPLLKLVAGKGWNSLLGPSLGSAEGSCFTASPWDSPGTCALTEGPTSSSSGLLPGAVCGLTSSWNSGCRSR